MKANDNERRFPPLEARPQDAPLALDGVKVVDFTRVLAGPWATQYLADMGADIVKVEDRRGDMSRWINALGGENASSFFLCANRNKRSIVLDLSQPEGRAVALDLIADADILVENFTSRVMKGFGLDHASLKDRFPRLIYCSISAYGRTGSMADAPGYDPIVSAETGLSALNRIDDGPPAVGTLPVVDLMAGMNGAIAILGALHARERLGVGQHVETSLYDGPIAGLSYKGAEYLIDGVAPRIVGRRAAQAPGGEFPTRNGVIWFTTQQEKSARALICDVLGMPHVYADARFSSVAARVDNRAALEALIVERLAEHDAEHWALKMKAAGIPAGVFRSVADAYAAPLVAERKLVREVPHPTLGSYADVASPIRMSVTPPADPVAAPALGADGEDILRDELRYDDARIAALVASGAVGSRRG